MTIFSTRPWRVPLGVSVTVLIILSFVAGTILEDRAVRAVETDQTISGVLPDGTRYGYVVPPGWNGKLVIDPDFMGFGGSEPSPSTAERWLLDEGYAVGGTSRFPTMDRVQESVAAMMGGLDLFEAAFGTADTTIVKGASLGGFTSRAVIELHPERLDGALAMCGGGSGVVGAWNQKLDTAFVAKTLLSPDSDIELVHITDASTATAAWNQLVEEASQSPEGRARLALAAAVGQMPTYANPALPQPGHRDFDLQLDHQISEFQLFVRPQIRSTVEAAAGGNISWNHDVDYRHHLNRSGLRQLVDHHYREAGLDLDQDLSTLAGQPRIAADPDAVAWAEDNISYSGDTGGNPVLSIHTAGDRSESLAFDAAYAETLRRAGNNSLLRQAWVERAGHCNFTQAERLAATVALLDRVETGRWANSTTSRSLNALAADLEADSNLSLGGSDFFDPRTSAFLRPWDGRHIGTYQPPTD